MNARRRLLRPAEIRRILVLQFGPIGDTLFAVPALKALRLRFPTATIAVLASPRAGEILHGAPYIDLLRVCRSGLDLMRSLFELRQAGFDLAVGLSNQGSWLAPFFGTPWKAGFPSPLLNLAEPGPVKEEPSSHVVEYCLAVVRMLGADPPDDGDGGLEIWLSDADHEGAERFLAAHRLTPPIVAIHPGGHYFPHKRWPAIRYAALADALAALGLKVVVIGGVEDVELASSVAQRARSGPVVAAGKLRLRETAALIARSALFIGNDSAPLHLAAAVKTPSIGLFGPTSPRKFSTYG
ncbi:MAG: glycosyltransferase family 9 protein, partial [Firmicutes bacterium]|nr:glycosyltransferase family 9 protein [Bacillota bacterium]